MSSHRKDLDFLHCFVFYGDKQRIDTSMFYLLILGVYVQIGFALYFFHVSDEFITGASVRGSVTSGISGQDVISS